MQNPSFLARKTLGQPNYFLIAMGVAFLVAFMPRGVRQAINSNNNNAADWLPSNYSESQDLQWFRDHFVGEQFALVSWDGCTLGNAEKLNHLVRKLTPSSDAVAHASTDSDLANRARWYKRIVTGPSVLEEMTSEAGGFDYGVACRRIEGALVGPKQVDAKGNSLGNESRATCAVVFLTPAATENNRVMRQAIEGIEATLVNDCDIPLDQIHMGGPPVDNIQIDIEGERTLIRLAALAGIVGVALSYWCFRSFHLTTIVFAVGVISAGMSLALVYYYGCLEFWIYRSKHLGTVDAILMSMPAVVYVLGLSGAIHTVNYYRDARRETGIHGAAERAVKMGWGPCALAAFTTAVGLGSLYTSDILPIKKFGLFSGIAVLGTIGVLFTILPVFLHRFPISDDLVRRQSGDHGPGASHLPGWAQRLFSIVINHNKTAFMMWLCVMAGVGFGMTKISTSVQLLKLLDEDADLIHDYAWLEKNLGNLVPMEIILTVPAERRAEPGEVPDGDGQQYRLTMVDTLAMLRRIGDRVEALPQVSRTLSLATFAPKQSNSGSSLLDESIDSTANRRLTEIREDLLKSDYVRLEKPAQGITEGSDQHTGEADRELWRLSARVAALSDDGEGVDYGLFVENLKEAVDPVLLAYDQRDMIVRQLAQHQISLRGSRFAMLYRSSGGGGKVDQKSQESLLIELLKESGAVAHKGGIMQFDLMKYDRVAGDTEEAKQASRQKLITALKQRFDALILVSAGSDPTAKSFAEQGLTVIDITDPPLLKHSGSAAVSLAHSALPRPIRAVYTGMVPVVYKTQRQLLKSLRESIGWASVLIACVMVVVLRSPMAGLISMIPNVFPIVIVFGALGWLGIKVDIGIMMTASVALGVAVDDTIHFLTWYRRGVVQGLDRKQSAMLAYDRCATAMLQTTLIGGLGLAVFATSSFTPTQQFGYLMITMLGAALVGDLLLLPAILAGPLGRFFGGSASTEAYASWPDPGAYRDDNHDGSDTDEPMPHPPELGETLELGTPTETAGSDVPAGSAPVGEPQRQSLTHGPHAELHAKLRRLRRKSSS